MPDRPLCVFEVFDPSPHLAEYDGSYLYFVSASEAKKFVEAENSKRLGPNCRFGDLIGPATRIIIKKPEELVDILNKHAQRMHEPIITQKSA